MVQLVACEVGGAAGVGSADIGTGAVYVMIVGPVGPGGGGGGGAGGPPQAASAVTARARTALRIGPGRWVVAISTAAPGQTGSPNVTVTCSYPSERASDVSMSRVLASARTARSLERAVASIFRAASW